MLQTALEPLAFDRLFLTGGLDEAIAFARSKVETENGSPLWRLRLLELSFASALDDCYLRSFSDICSDELALDDRLRLDALVARQALELGDFERALRGARAIVAQDVSMLSSATFVGVATAIDVILALDPGAPELDTALRRYVELSKNAGNEVYHGTFLFLLGVLRGRKYSLAEGERFVREAQGGLGQLGPWFAGSFAYPSIAGKVSWLCAAVQSSACADDIHRRLLSALESKITSGSAQATYSEVCAVVRESRRLMDCGRANDALALLSRVRVHLERSDDAGARELLGELCLVEIVFSYAGNVVADPLSELARVSLPSEYTMAAAAAVHYDLGGALVAKQRAADAIAYFERAMELRRQSGIALANIHDPAYDHSICLVLLGRAAEAVAVFESYVALLRNDDPRSATVRVFRGKLVALRDFVGGRYRDGILSLTSVLEEGAEILPPSGLSDIAGELSAMSYLVGDEETSRRANEQRLRYIARIGDGMNAGKCYAEVLEELLRRGQFREAMPVAVVGFPVIEVQPSTPFGVAHPFLLTCVLNEDFALGDRVWKVIGASWSFAVPAHGDSTFHCEWQLQIIDAIMYAALRGQSFELASLRAELAQVASGRPELLPITRLVEFVMDSESSAARRSAEQYVSKRRSAVSARNSMLQAAARKIRGLCGKNAGMFVATGVLFVLASVYSGGVEFAAALFLVLLFHELGHVVAMRCFGYSNTKILFLPFLGALALGATPSGGRSPRKEFVIAAAGPIPGLLLASAGMMVGARDWHPLLEQAISIAFAVNLFNLIPMPPLDGANMLKQIGRKPRPLGRVVALALSTLLFLRFAEYSPVVWIVVAMLGFATISEARAFPLRRRMLRLIKAERAESGGAELSEAEIGRVVDQVAPKLLGVPPKRASYIRYLRSVGGANNIGILERIAYLAVFFLAIVGPVFVVYTTVARPREFYTAVEHLEAGRLEEAKRILAQSTPREDWGPTDGLAYQQLKAGIALVDKDAALAEKALDEAEPIIASLGDVADYGAKRNQAQLRLMLAELKGDVEKQNQYLKAVEEYDE